MSVLVFSSALLLWTFGRISDWIRIVKNDLDKRGGVILDLNVDNVIYREYAKMLSYPSNIESGEKDYVDFDSSSSSLIEKKKKKLKKSWVSKSREILFP